MNGNARQKTHKSWLYADMGHFKEEEIWMGYSDAEKVAFEKLLPFLL